MSIKDNVISCINSDKQLCDLDHQQMHKATNF